MLPCDLSLITIHISEWRYSSDVHISLGSVETCLRRDGIFKNVFLANFLPSPSVKKFENRLLFGEVMGKCLVSYFFDSQCSIPNLGFLYSVKLSCRRELTHALWQSEGYLFRAPSKSTLTPRSLKKNFNLNCTAIKHGNNGQCYNTLSRLIHLIDVID